LRGASYGFDNEVWSGDKDIREGLRNFLDGIADGVVSPWKHVPFLWLLSHEDPKVEGYDYKAINEERIAMLPEHVRKDIGQ